MCLPTCENKIAVYICLDPVVLVLECRAINKEKGMKNLMGLDLYFYYVKNCLGFGLRMKARRYKELMTINNGSYSLCITVKSI